MAKKKKAQTRAGRPSKAPAAGSTAPINEVALKLRLMAWRLQTLGLLRQIRAQADALITQAEMLQ